MGERFRTIVADPPWHYAREELWGRDNVEDHYPTLSVEQVAAMPIESFAADDAYLWLWITARHFEEGAHRPVCAGWGFTYRAWRVWGKPSIGMGYWLRYSHEVLVLATRGKVAPLSDLGSWFQESRDRHSRKPAGVYRDIEERCPGPRLELFARLPRPDQRDLLTDNPEWTVWGNEVGDPMGIGFDPENWETTPPEQPSGAPQGAKRKP